MNTYTALVSAKVGTATKLVKTEIKAACASDAKWLLQAIYGFHAIASFPQERREVLTSEDLSKPPTSEQQRLNALKSDLRPYITPLGLGLELQTNRTRYSTVLISYAA